MAMAMCTHCPLACNHWLRMESLELFDCLTCMCRGLFGCQLMNCARLHQHGLPAKWAKEGRNSLKLGFARAESSQRVLILLGLRCWCSALLASPRQAESGFCCFKTRIHCPSAAFARFWACLFLGRRRQLCLHEELVCCVITGSCFCRLGR